MLGFVSSLTRDNPHFATSLLGSSSLRDGEQRARKLGNTRVQIRDVRPDAEVGHIALAEEELRSHNLRDKRGSSRIVSGRLCD